jgi:hypothetical protein
MERHFFCYGLAIARDKKPTWTEPRPEHVKAWRDMSDGHGPHWKTTLSRTDSQLEAELRSAVELVRRGWEKYWSDTPDEDGNGGFTVLTFPPTGDTFRPEDRRGLHVLVAGWLESHENENLNFGDEPPTEALAALIKLEASGLAADIGFDGQSSKT